MSFEFSKVAFYDEGEEVENVFFTIAFKIWILLKNAIQLSHKAAIFAAHKIPYSLGF